MYRYRFCLGCNIFLSRGCSQNFLGKKQMVQITSWIPSTYGFYDIMNSFFKNISVLVLINSFVCLHVCTLLVKGVSLWSSRRKISTGCTVRKPQASARTWLSTISIARPTQIFFLLTKFWGLISGLLVSTLLTDLYSQLTYIILGQYLLKIFFEAVIFCWIYKKQNTLLK